MTASVGRVQLKHQDPARGDCYNAPETFGAKCSLPRGV
jgi:hypothetical protein